MRKSISLFLAVLLVLNPCLMTGAKAGTVFSGLNLPPAGQALSLTPAFAAVGMEGLVLDQQDPLKFGVLVNKGGDNMSESELKLATQKQVRYFLAALTTPENDLWVNLSPYEDNRILPDTMARTEIGRDLLAQDYLLKQLSASVTHPESALGKSFWDGIFKQAAEKFGTADISTDLFSKVWIVPSKVVIYEKDNKAFLVDARLKVMTEKDFLAMEMNRAGKQPAPAAEAAKDDVSAAVLKQIVVPALEREVNEGKNFANLRQIYQAVVLASWYKGRLKSGLLAKVYVDQAKTSGVEAREVGFKEAVYQKYLDAFRKGVYNMIKETVDPVDGAIVPRKYVSGGVNLLAVRDREITQDPALLKSRLTDKDFAMGSFTLQPWTANNDAAALPDIRSEEKGGALPVYGDPKRFALWAQVNFPRPANRTNNRGEIISFWSMTTALSEILLEVAPTADKPFRLGSRERGEITRIMMEKYFLHNIMDSDLGFSLEDLFSYLVELGFVSRLGEGTKEYYIDYKMRPRMAVWARLNIEIEKQLDKVFAADGRMNEEALMALIREYDDIASNEKLDLVEPFQPFLRAVLELAPERRMKIVDYLHKRFFEGENPAFTGGMMVDAILLTFDRLSKEEIAKWGRKVFPLLTDGRSVYLGAAEITLLKGGLGRVMQYLGRAMHGMGVNVVFVEPRYEEKYSFDMEGNAIIPPAVRKYEEISIPLHMPALDKPSFKYTVHFDGKDVEVWAYEAVNDEGITVLTFRDIDGVYIKDIYYEGPGSKHADVQALFLAKAMWGAIQYREERVRQEAKTQGKPVHDPVVSLNDGQVLLASIFRLFDPAYQAESSVLAHVQGTGHTVKNTVNISQDALRIAGVPEKYWHFLKFMNIYGGEAYDATKGALSVITALGGAANNVSVNHRDAMRRFMPTLGGVIYGLTNGDRLPLTMREWNKAFVELGFADEATQRQLAVMEPGLQNPDPFKSSEVRNQIDLFLLKSFWTHWDDQSVSDEKRMEWVKAVKKHLKKKYFLTMLSNEQYRQSMGIVIPTEYAGREAEFIEKQAEELSNKLLKIYSGRGVDEKLGLHGAHTQENLQHRAELGIVTVLQANKQYYPGTNKPNGSVYLVNQLNSQAKHINQQGLPGKVFIEDTFGPATQLLLLGGADVVALDSTTMKREGGELLPTGASESTEVHGMSLFQGPPELHGFINYIASFGKVADGKGTYFSPADQRPVSYARLDELQAKMWEEGKIPGMVFHAVNQFRAIDTILTAGMGYAPLWESAVGREEDRRAKLAKQSGNSVIELLLAQYQALARPEGEVNLTDEVSGALLSKFMGTQSREDLAVFNMGQGTELYLPSTQEATEALELSIIVDPQGIDSNLISASLVQNGFLKRIFPMSQTGLTEDGKLIYSLRVDPKQWREWHERTRLEFEATGGSWHIRRPLTITRRMSDEQIANIRAKVAEIAEKNYGHGFKLEFKGGKPGERRVTHVENQDLVVKVTIPLGGALARQLKVVPKVQASNRRWEFLALSRFSVENVHVGRDSTSMEIRINSVNTHMKMTFAAFDQEVDPYAPGGDGKALVWATTGNSDDDLTIDVISYRENLKRQSIQQEADAARDEAMKTDQLGGIKLDPALAEVSVLGHAKVQSADLKDVPLVWQDISGVMAQLQEFKPNVNVPAVMGLGTVK